MTTCESKENASGSVFPEFPFDRPVDIDYRRFYYPVPFEYWKEMRYLSNEEFGALIRIAMWYSMSGEQLPVEGVLCHYMTRVIEREKRFLEEWKRLAESRSRGGKKTAEKRWKKEE